MKIIRGLSNLLLQHTAGAMTIGKFDGVHLGHQTLFEQMKLYAKKHSLPSIVMIFEPSPNDFFNRDSSEQSRLSTLREKIYYIAQAEIDYLLIISFNGALAKQKASDFIEEILIEKLKVNKLWVGDDFKFGFQRQGDYSLLERYKERGAFELSQIDSCFMDAKRVSSSTIRRLVSNGQFGQVEKLLGHPFSISGYVVKGKQLGQTIGFPTMNLGIRKQHRRTLSLLSFGVYLVRVKVYQSKDIYRSYDGVANLGIKPTINDEQKLSFESYCFQLSESVYGRMIRIEIRQFIRAEKQFASLQQLKDQIAKDIEIAQNYLN